MSYTIEYNKAIFYIENEGEKVYFLFIRQGDNNVYEADNKLRAKDWYFAYAGTEKELWKYIGRRSGSTEGGGLQRAVGWEETKWYTIEEYIKQYRSKIKNAKPLETFFESFSIDANIYLRDELQKPESEEVATLLRGIIDKYSMTPSGSDWYDKTQIRYYTSIRDLDTLKDFLLNVFSRSCADGYVRLNVHKYESRGRRRRFGW